MAIKPEDYEHDEYDHYLENAQLSANSLDKSDGPTIGENYLEEAHYAIANALISIAESLNKIARKL